MSQEILSRFARLGDVHSLENISGHSETAAQAMHCSWCVGGVGDGPWTPNSKPKQTGIDGMAC